MAWKIVHSQPVVAPVLISLTLSLSRLRLLVKGYSHFYWRGYKLSFAQVWVVTCGAPCQCTPVDGSRCLHSCGTHSDSTVWKVRCMQAEKVGLENDWTSRTEECCNGLWGRKATATQKRRTSKCRGNEQKTDYKRQIPGSSNQTELAAVSWGREIATALAPARIGSLPCFLCTREWVSWCMRSP